MLLTKEEISFIISFLQHQRKELLILKNWCSQSVVGNIVAFRVHAPCSGAFLLDIFANAVTPKEYLTGEPMKFKSVCKFKIACEELQTVMVPLPDCASGEWGPTKATRLFGLIPITHQVGRCLPRKCDIATCAKCFRIERSYHAAVHYQWKQGKHLSENFFYHLLENYKKQ